MKLIPVIWKNNGMNTLIRKMMSNSILERYMKYTIITFIVLLSIASLIYAKQALPWVELTVSPSKETEASKQYRLLPTEQEQTDFDAVPLYQKAIQSLPEDFDPKQFSDWRSLPPDQLPVEEVEPALKKLKPTLDLVSNAAKCKQCNWPIVKPEQAQQQIMGDLSKYRQLAFVLDVQAKLQIAQGRYDQAIGTLKASLAMAKHLGEANTLIQGLVGIAIAELNYARIEQFIQSDNAPNLYGALKNLPQPFIDITKAIDFEIDNLKNYNVLIRKQFEKQLKPAHDRVRKMMNHVDRKIAALQIIEALRLYAGAHDSKFPDKLSDVSEVEIPDDPVTKKPFSYKSTGSEAVLELEGTEGSEDRDAVRYELKLK
jgi:tetratricopeptide (TPR) repeat protein